MFFKTKNHNYLYSIILFFSLVNCQFQDPYKNHGITFLDNRANKLFIQKTNIHDAIRILGQPHSKSITDEKTWIYIERVLTKGSFHKLGQNVTKTNNVLVLTFDKYGVLKEKNFLDKSSINKLKFSEKITENNLTKKSFVQNLLQSVRSKMYQNRK